MRRLHGENLAVKLDVLMSAEDARAGQAVVVVCGLLGLLEDAGCLLLACWVVVCCLCTSTVGGTNTEAGWGGLPR